MCDATEIVRLLLTHPWPVIGILLAAGWATAAVVEQLRGVARPRREEAPDAD